MILMVMNYGVDQHYANMDTSFSRDLMVCGQWIDKTNFHVLYFKYMDASMHIHVPLFGVTWDILLRLRYLSADNIWRLSVLRENFQSSLAQMCAES